MKLKTLLREANENPMLKELEQRLKSHDWWYQYSDDHRYWVRGGQEMDAIRKLVAQINEAGLEKEGEAIWKKTAPDDFKTWYPKKLKEATHPIGSLGRDMNTTPNPNISRTEYEADVKLWSSKAAEFEKIKKNLESRLKRTKNPNHKETLEGEIEYVQDQIDTFKGMVYDLRRIIKNIK